MDLGEVAEIVIPALASSKPKGFCLSQFASNVAWLRMADSGVEWPRPEWLLSRGKPTRPTSAVADHYIVRVAIGGRVRSCGNPTNREAAFW